MLEAMEIPYEIITPKDTENKMKLLNTHPLSNRYRSGLTELTTLREEIIGNIRREIDSTNCKIKDNGKNEQNVIGQVTQLYHNSFRKIDNHHNDINEIIEKWQAN